MAQMFDPQNPEMLELNRQRRMADLLTAQGMQTPQAQNVSGIYVPPNPMEYLAKLYSTYQGTKANRELDSKELALAKALREQEIKDITQFSELQYGGKEIPAQAQAGPMPSGGNIPIGTTLSEPNPMAAFEVAARSRSPLVRSQLAEMLKGQKLGEGEIIQRYNPATGKMETTGQGAAKYRAPIQIDTGTAIELRDPLDPTKVISRVAKSQMPTAGQVVEREDGTYLVDTRTGQARPIMGQSGQPLMGAGKPLTESQGKASAFQSQMVSASNAVNTLESQGFDPTSLKSQTAVKLAGGAANPAIPVAAQQYKQAQDQWSEAYLRFKTGAAATEPEVVRNNRTFFPVFGDKPNQIAQKAVAREQAERDIGIAAGRGSMLGAQPIGQQPKQVPTKPAGMPSQSAIDAELKRRGL